MERSRLRLARMDSIDSEKGQASSPKRYKATTADDGAREEGKMTWSSRVAH